MIPDDLSPLEPQPKSDPNPTWWILAGMLSIILVGGMAFVFLRKPIGPAPPEVARDPLLSLGRAIYLARCIACHGVEGRGDGPIAKNLVGPPPGNLTDTDWKHGDRPEQVTRVIADGIPNTRMDGWGKVLDPPEVKAVASYVYYLASRSVPDELRIP